MASHHIADALTNTEIAYKAKSVNKSFQHFATGITAIRNADEVAVPLKVCQLLPICVGNDGHTKTRAVCFWFTGLRTKGAEPSVGA